MTTWLFWRTTHAQYAGANKGENKSHRVGHAFFYHMGLTDRTGLSISAFVSPFHLGSLANKAGFIAIMSL